MYRQTSYLLLAMAGMVLGGSSSPAGYGMSLEDAERALRRPLPDTTPPQGFAYTGSTWDPIAGMRAARHNRNKARSRKRPGSTPRHRRARH
jgi:hypothetical protein